MRFIIVLLCVALAACNRNGTQPAAGPNPSETKALDQSPQSTPGSASPSVGAVPRKTEIVNPNSEMNELPRVSDETYAGPAARLRVLQRESHPVQYVAEAVITAPTGGWTLSLDEGHVINGSAKVFLTLEKPASDEIVTQALVEHRKLFATTERFTTVDVYVHIAQRGVQTLTTDYRLAARSAIPTATPSPASSSPAKK